jgi:hypothetical protein
MSEDAVIDLSKLYLYGYKGQDMIAVTSPFRMSADKPELIGRRVRIDGAEFRVTAIGRITQGPIHKGEIIGIVVEN